MEKNRSQKKISRIITIRLFIVVFIAFIVSSSVTYTVLYLNCDSRAHELLRNNSMSLVFDFNDELYNMMFNSYSSQMLKVMIEDGEDGIREMLKDSNYTYLARTDGTIYISGNEEFIGKNIKDIPLISDFLDETLSHVRSSAMKISSFQMTPKPVRTLDEKLDVYYMLIITSDFPDTVFLEAFTTETLMYESQYLGAMVTSHRSIGLTGISVSINSDRILCTYLMDDVSDKPFDYPELLDKFDEGTDDSIYQTSTFYTTNGNDDEITTNIMYFRDVLWGKEYFGSLTESHGVYLMSLYPAAEALEQANNTIVYIVLTEIAVFAVLFIVLRLLIKRRVVKKLESVNDTLDRITAGDLDKKVEVRDSYEFNTLSDDINATVDKLKDYIAEAAARIDADLSVAKSIQSSALPNVFPPFPEKKSFELYASMNAAKEVGGDFYDFFMIDSNTLGFLIADVSGKSIPGAMFMMTSKTVIKSLAESGLPPAEVFTQANEKLCEGNEAEMFVTAWLGYLDINTGLVRVANAGHNPPLLIHDGKAEYVILKPGLMLAGMESIRYKEQTLQLAKGDMLYLYTDGVTEAMNKDEEQYGEDRLQKLLSFGENCPAPSEKNGIAEPVCDIVTADVTKFTNGAEQSDDITMLCIRFLGGE